MSKSQKYGGAGSVRVQGMAKFQAFDSVTAENGMIVFYQKENPPVRLLPSEAIQRVQSFLEMGSDEHMSSEVRIIYRELAEKVYEAYRKAKYQQECPADGDAVMVGNLDNGKMADNADMDLRLTPEQQHEVRRWKFEFPWIQAIELSAVVRSAYSEDHKRGMLKEINEERAAKKNLKAIRDGLGDSPLLDIKA